MASWKIFTKGRKFEYFDESKEKKWNGPFYFIQGADIQFGFIARELENKNVITWDEENLLAENIVERINQMRPKPKFFAMCGDLCDAMPDSEPEMRKKQEYDYKRIFGKLDKDIPLINVCGNHDVGNIPTSETVQMFRSSFGDDYFSFYCGGVLFLVINSQYFFDSSNVPSLADEHSKWINEKLEEAQKENLRVVIFQHIPWFLNTVDEAESYFTLKMDVREKWLAKFKEAGVEAIFCGHYHRNAGGNYNGIDVVVTSAVGGQLGNDKPGNSKINDEAVEELENLKNAFRAAVEGNIEEGDDVSVSKSQVSVFHNLNGSKSAHKEISSSVDKNGELLAKLSQKMVANKDKAAFRTELDIPSEGIHKVIKNGGDEFVKEKKKEESIKLDDRMNKVNDFSDVKYRPLDMAEYIFWTGDEKGVALTIKEFLEQGLMSRQQAINFLQSIKYNLDFMQSHYQDLAKMYKISEKAAGQTVKTVNEDIYTEKRKDSFYDEVQKDSKLTPIDLVNIKSASEVVPDLKQSYEEKMSTSNTESKSQPYSDKIYPNLSTQTGAKTFDGEAFPDEDYDEMMERMRKTDALEGVIFELTKIMFSESLIKKNPGAQKAMQKFSGYLLNEVKRGQISAVLERKILDILLTALVEALSEHPELLNRSLEELQRILERNSTTSRILRQTLLSGSKEVSTQPSVKTKLLEKILLLGKSKLL